MKIENVEVYGFRRALHGMRNPKNSWDRSDSRFGLDGLTSVERCTLLAPYEGLRIIAAETPIMGERDLELACNLIKGGSVHAKFLRQIMVWWDITICRGVWQELDTYKVATVRNSCSTMHKLGSRDLTEDDFEDRDVRWSVVEELNIMGRCYRHKDDAGQPASLPYTDPNTDKVYEGVELLRHMKMRLPESFLQKATYSFSYQTALEMYRWRHDHRMREWSGKGGICDVIAHLPYMAEFLAAAGLKVTTP